MRTSRPFVPSLQSVRALLVPLFPLALVCSITNAVAQESTVEEPTRGLYLPSTPLAGEYDATTTSVNPAGLSFLPGGELALALSFEDKELARAGRGVGLYKAGAWGGTLFPKIGWGIGLEWLRHSREIEPDPGDPLRLQLANSLSLGPRSAIGFSWQHYFDKGKLTGGLDSFDFGWTFRSQRYWTLAAVVRDLNTPELGSYRVQRHYEGELGIRPLGTDRLDLQVGTRIAEEDLDGNDGLDYWLKWSAKIVDGVFMRGQVGSESLFLASGGDLRAVRETRMSLGFEFTLGGLSTAAYGTIQKQSGEDARAAGGTIVARVSEVPPPSILPSPYRMERLQLRGVIGQRALTAYASKLRRLGRDKKVVGLFVQIGDVNAGWAVLHELRRELQLLRKKGKKVIVFMAEGDTRDYFLASVADKIYIDPIGGIRLQGLSATSLYFTGLFEKIGVSAQFEKIEEYKSAPESWTEKGPSEPALRMRNELYDDYYETIVSEIAEGRGLSKTRVKALIDGGPYTAGELTKLPDLVDAVVTADKLPALVDKEMGGSYAFAGDWPKRADRWSRPEVAVIYVVGDIVGGRSRVIPILGRTLVGGQTVVEAIREAALDSDIEAIVLRISSPGGSALASELMAREVEKVRGSGKPIICSMGNSAASGGYFVAAHCDRIFADEMTLTGSIGIFNGSFDFSEMLSKLGLTWHTYKRGENSDFGSMYRPMTEKERKDMKTKLHYFYGRFIAHVARGRDMTTEEVNQVGRGQVWTGRQALGNGLVDEIGGLMDAIAYAKAQAGVDELANLRLLPRVERSLISQLIGSPFGKAQGEAVSVLSSLLPGGLRARLLDFIPASIWDSPAETQARLPFAIDWNDGSTSAGIESGDEPGADEIGE